MAHVALGLRVPPVLAIVIFAFLFISPSHAYTVICNGDSNTQANPSHPADNWCAILAQHPGLSTINRGMGGSGIVDNGLSTYGAPLWASFYTTYELIGIDPLFILARGGAFWKQIPTFNPLPTYDAVVLAYGTNDIAGYHFSVRDIIRATKVISRQFLDVGIDVFVATVPPLYDSNGSLSSADKAIQRLNRRIRRLFPDRYIEFYEGMTYPDDYSNGRHFNASGQAKRAQAALTTLLRSTPLANTLKPESAQPQ